MNVHPSFATVEPLVIHSPYTLPLIVQLAFLPWCAQRAAVAGAQTPPTTALQSVLDGEIETLPVATQPVTAAFDKARPQVRSSAPIAARSIAPSQAASTLHPGEPESHDAGEEIDALLTKMVLGHLPHQFEQDKDWGKQAERFDGLRVRRKGLQIRTKRKKKMVNHGNWKKFGASLVDPDQKFSVSVKNMREADDGKVAFDLHCRSDLKIDGRVAKWVKGVQLYSLSLQGKARVNLAVTIELETVMDVTKFPPDLIFRPQTTSAHLEVEEFRIDRISKIGGEVAQQATQWARRAIDAKIATEEAKLVEKINRDLKKNQKKLRLSLHDAVSSKWSQVATGFMPADVQAAMRSAR